MGQAPEYPLDVFMLITLLILETLAVIALAVFAWQTHHTMRFTRDILDDRKRFDFYYDQLMRTFFINVTDPYINRPGFEEKRCNHCNYPIGEAHASNCIWQMMTPLRTYFYKQQQNS